MELRRLAADVWLHVTRDASPAGVPANGLLVDTEAGAVLIDTGWTEPQTEALMSHAARMAHPLAAVIVTHAHVDRVGGAAVALRHGVPVFAAPATIERCRAGGLPLPDRALDPPHTLRFGGRSFEIFYPGPGHSPDNVVVWLAHERILFAGCFAKAASASDLGHVGDADLGAWPASLQRTRQRYPRPSQIVPGHGSPGGDPIARTLQLLLQAAAETSARKP